LNYNQPIDSPPDYSSKTIIGPEHRANNRSEREAIDNSLRANKPALTPDNQKMKNSRNYSDNVKGSFLLLIIYIYNKGVYYNKFSSDDKKLIDFHRFWIGNTMIFLGTSRCRRL
jgi:hypothetical protein